MAIIDLEAIEERLKATTPRDKWRGGVYYNDGAYPIGPYSRSSSQAEADGKFIGRARGDIEDLVSVVRELQAVRVEYEKLVKALREHGAHTTECIVNAAHTRRSFCIQSCADRWRPLISPELDTRPSPPATDDEPITEATCSCPNDHVSHECLVHGPF